MTPTTSLITSDQILTFTLFRWWSQDTTYSRSNFYQVLPDQISPLNDFATSCDHISSVIEGSSPSTRWAEDELLDTGRPSNRIRFELPVMSCRTHQDFIPSS